METIEIDIIDFNEILLNKTVEKPKQEREYSYKRISKGTRLVSCPLNFGESGLSRVMMFISKNDGNYIWPSVNITFHCMDVESYDHVKYVMSKQYKFAGIKKNPDELSSYGYEYFNVPEKVLGVIKYEIESRLGMDSVYASKA